MIKKSLKYFLVAGVNAFILTIFLALWTDKLELLYHSLVRPIEFLKIIGITIICLIGMRILVESLRKRKVEDTRRRIMFAMILTFIISSYLYVTYSVKLTNVFFNQTRRSLSEKVEQTDRLNGSKGDNLTYKEYQELRRITRFVQLPETASNISFTFDYDGFLPDFGLDIKYEVPLTTEIEEKHIDEGYDFSQDQTFKIENGRKIVTYSEVVR